jgi:hypothetical protein
MALVYGSKHSCQSLIVADTLLIEDNTWYMGGSQSMSNDDRLILTVLGRLNEA